MITIDYINRLLTANNRAELRYNTLLMGKQEYEEAKHMTYIGCEVDDRPCIEKILNEHGIRLVAINEESFIGFANTDPIEKNRIYYF